MTGTLRSLTDFVRESPSAIAMFDRDMCYLAASQRWKADYKLQSNLLGLSHYDVFPETPAAWKAIHRRALAGETVRGNGETHQRLDVDPHDIEWSAFPWLDAHQQVGGIVVSMHHAPEDAANGSNGGANGYGPASAGGAFRSPGQQEIIDRLRFGNLVLSAMPEPFYARLREHLTPVKIKAGDILVDSVPPPAVLFPLEGLYAVVRVLEDGSTLEVAKAGKASHGLLSVMLGSNQMESETIAVVGGAALSLPAQRLRDVLHLEPGLREWVHSVLGAVVGDLANSAVCAVRHAAPRRLARWLLLASRVSGLREFPVRQETLALLLGIRRTGVSEALSHMRRAGLIDTRRGTIVIRDPERLAAHACECWREDVVQRQGRMDAAALTHRFEPELPVADLLRRHDEFNFRENRRTA